MTHLEWFPEFESGINTIDDKQRLMVQKINPLGEAIQYKDFTSIKERMACCSNLNVFLNNVFINFGVN